MRLKQILLIILFYSFLILHLEKNFFLSYHHQLIIKKILIFDEKGKISLIIFLASTAQIFFGDFNLTLKPICFQEKGYSVLSTIFIVFS